MFTAKIALNVTDKNNIQIYLPEFGNVTPQVDLRLRQIPGGKWTSDVSSINMCLYDGYNSQSTWFDVTASDGLSIGDRDPGIYSVLHENDRSGERSKRIDYRVSLGFNNQKIQLANGQTMRLSGVNNSPGRSVTLPNIPVPVICTPAPLMLDTPEFDAKQAGRYSGNLRITFSPSSANL